MPNKNTEPTVKAEAAYSHWNAREAEDFRWPPWRQEIHNHSTSAEQKQPTMHGRLTSKIDLNFTLQWRVWNNQPCDEDIVWISMQRVCYVTGRQMCWGHALLFSSEAFYLCIQAHFFSQSKSLCRKKKHFRTYIFHSSTADSRWLWFYFSHKGA